jgi:hypothetical protein
MNKLTGYFLSLLLGLAGGFFLRSGLNDSSRPASIPLNQLISEVGSYEIVSEHVFLEVTGSPPAYSFVVRRIQPDRREVVTTLKPGWEPRDGWFVSFDPPDHIWAYDGNENLHLARIMFVGVDYGSMARYRKERNIPDNVRWALPKDVLAKYEGEQIDDGNAEKPLGDGRTQ